MTFQQAYDPFRALGSAWNAARKGPWSIGLGGVLLWACWLGQSHFGKTEIRTDDIHSARELAQLIVSILTERWLGLLGLLSCGLSLASWLFECLLRIGFGTVVERALQGERDEPARLFNSRGRYPSMVLTTLLQGCIWIAVCVPGLAIAALAAFVAHQLLREDWAVVLAFAGVFALYVPVVIYFALGISLAPYAIAIEGMGTGEAFSRSWSLVRGHRWQLLLYWLVFGVLKALCCMCCFVVAPACFIASNESYLRLVRAGEPETWPKNA